MSAFVIQLSVSTATGNLKQVYLPDCTPGAGTGVSGTQKRSPISGVLWSAEVQTDGINGGTIELWDLSGEDCGANVDTGTTITEAQRVIAASQTPPKARLIYSQTFAGSGTARLAVNKGTQFNWGLAARFVGVAGSLNLNLDVEGGHKKVWIAGL